MPRVLVTGAADRIGKHIACHFAQKGFDVIIHYNQSGGKAHETQSELQEKFPSQNFYKVQADFSHVQQIQAFTNRILEECGPVDVLINNASSFQYDTLSSFESENLSAAMNIHLMAPLLLSQYFAYHTSQLKLIVNIVDSRVLNLTPYFLSYTLAKSALWSATQMLALQLAPQIRVNAIAPGPTLVSAGQDPQKFKELCKATPLGHGVDLNDFSLALDFLLSAQSLTGQMLALDSGQHLGWMTQDANKKTPRFL